MTTTTKPCPKCGSTCTTPYPELNFMDMTIRVEYWICLDCYARFNVNMAEKAINNDLVPPSQE